MRQAVADRHMSKERNSGYEHVDDEIQYDDDDFDMMMTMPIALMMTKTLVSKAKKKSFIWT